MVDVLANDRDDGGVHLLEIVDVRIDERQDRELLDASIGQEQQIAIVAGPQPGIVDVTYIVADGRGRSSLSTLEVEITAIPPTLIPDQVTIDAGSVALVDVLENDLPPGGLDPDTLSIVSSTGGEVGLEEDGDRIQVEPAAGFLGTIEVVYEVCNFGDQCERSTLTVLVEPAGTTGRGQIQVAPGGTQEVPWLVVSAGASPPPTGGSVQVVSGGELFSVTPTINDEGSLIFDALDEARGTAVLVVQTGLDSYELTVVVG